MSTKEHQCDKECKHGSTGYEQTIDELKFESKLQFKISINIWYL
jgi:hypothetical protein